MNILIIEDNADLAASLWDYLESKGHVIDAAGDGVTGMNLATANEYDVIALDLILPGLDGLELCHRLRVDARKCTPVLMLTARDTLQDKLRGFEVGADDYLVKPFALQELDARLRALARRGKPGSGTRILQVSDLTLDLDTLEVERAGHPIALTPTGLQVLEVLMRRPGCVVTRRELETELWGDQLPDSDALSYHIHALRRAIDKPFRGHLLRTVRRIGYRLSRVDTIQT
ncbi:MAG: response regulator transcription factor [Chromatiaceae bacterium]|nr:response regulator transcription factor [Chromatiaceae bacterium]